MSFSEILHKLILGPIELLFDVVFSFSMQMTSSPVLSIVVLSLVINLLVLPLYRRADALQREENEISKRLKPDIDHIKAVFTGDQRFMTLQSYYRKMHYKPYYVLRSSLSLLLQIPFFMAAYNFLSHLNVLRGVSFGPIADLAAPDGMLTVFGITVNVLPILMTLINLISGYIYSKDLPLKSKIQMYGIAFVFLVLLYNSPSGLVFYWTLNNLFSLGKNIFNRLPNSKKVLRLACSLLGLIVEVFFVLRFNQYGAKKAAFGIAAAILAQIPMAVYWISRRYSNKQEKTPEKAEKAEKAEKESRIIFVVSCILLTVLTGLLIPSAVIHASPAEFVEVGAFRSPLVFVLQAFLLAAGTFLIWCIIYYLLMGESGKSFFSVLFAVMAITALVNYMFFGNSYGNMSSTFVYDTDFGRSNQNVSKVINTGVLLVLSGAVVLLWKKKRVILKVICILMCLAITGMSLANIWSVNSRIPEIQRLANQQQESKDDIIILDKNGKNVVVLMLDRAIGYYAPYIFAEKPELKEQFAGFVCYQNTLSYGSSTNTGTPALFGGYEYTPDKIDQRSDMLLKDKQNEALKVMPVVFQKEGFKVTVCDPPFSNYQWIPDLSIYSDYPEIRTYLTEEKYENESAAGIENRKTARERNLFCYSIFRISPVLIHSELYDEGNYNKSDVMKKEVNFIGSYAVLTNLSQITNVQDMGENTFLMMANHSTHNPVFFQEPEYLEISNVDNSRYDSEHPNRQNADGKRISMTDGAQLMHYQTNMASLIQVGKWLDYLRENGVYDNTRIIIVSDHAASLGYPEMLAADLNLNIGYFNPLLLVKDFDCRGIVEFSNEFMTNADTPVMAFAGIVEEPVNPFTQQPVTDTEKKKNEQIVCMATWDVNEDLRSYVFNHTQYFIVSNHEVMNPMNWSVAE